MRNQTTTYIYIIYIYIRIYVTWKQKILFMSRENRYTLYTTNWRLLLQNTGTNRNTLVNWYFAVLMSSCFLPRINSGRQIVWWNIWLRLIKAISFSRVSNIATGITCKFHLTRRMRKVICGCRWTRGLAALLLLYFPRRCARRATAGDGSQRHLSLHCHGDDFVRLGRVGSHFFH